MRFTGQNLAFVQAGLRSHLAEVRNMIATCPEPEHYAEQLAQYEAEETAVGRLLVKVTRTIHTTAMKENQKP